MGRPTKYSKNISDAICRNLSLGATRTAAAQAAGIHRDTLAEWLKSFPAFSDAVARSEAEAEVRCAAAITKAMPSDWRAAAFWLSRRRNKSWGEKKQIDLRNLTTEQLIALLNEEDSGGVGEAERDPAEPED